MGYRKISHDVKIATIRLYERGLLELNDILDCCGFLCHTWYCVLKLWHKTGNVIPEAQSLWGCVWTLDQEDINYLLELIRDNPDYFLGELLSLLETNHFISVHYTTIFCELKQLNVSRKKLKRITLERDEEQRADYIACMAWYSPEEVGFLNEMSKDVHSVGRHYGRSRRNTCAQKKQAFVHGQHTSAEALLTLDGIVTGTVVEGSMTKELFLEYLEFNVVSSPPIHSLQFLIPPSSAPRVLSRPALNSILQSSFFPKFETHLC